MSANAGGGSTWGPVPPGTIFQVWEDTDPSGEGGVTTIRALDAQGWLSRGLLGRRPRLVLDFAADSWDEAGRVHEEHCERLAADRGGIMSVATTGDIRERVRRGAALLDVKVPDWEHRIDLNDLDIESCADCVLGQLFGYYADGMRTLGHPLADKLSEADDPAHAWSLDHGFHIEDPHDGREQAAAWRAEINDRRRTP